MTFSKLADLSTSEVANLPTEELALLLEEQAEARAALRANSERLMGALTARYGSRATEVRTAAGKTTGTARIDDGDFTVVVDLAKKVEWQQALMAEGIEKLREWSENPAEYGIEAEYKIPERKWSVLPDMILALFRPARTVKPGSQSFEIVRKA